MSGGVTCCPFGGMSASFIVLGIVNFVLSMVGSFGCSMMYFPTYPVEGIRGVPSDNLGPWTYEGSYVTCDGGFNCVEGYVCYGYGSGSTFDSAWTAGRAFSMMAGILAIINFVLICCFACLSFPPKMFTVVAGLCIFNGVVQLISLCTLATQLCTGSLGGFSECKLGSSGIIAIVAAVLWFALACIMMIWPNKDAREEVDDLPPINAGAAAAPAGQVTVEKTVEERADGTKVTKTTTTNPDGSKTVEETVEK